MKRSHTIGSIFFFVCCISFAVGYHEELIELIEDRTIIFDGKMGSLKLFLGENPSAARRMDLFVLEFPHLAYTALKCKYADYVVDLLQTFICVIEYGIQNVLSDIDQIPSENKPWTGWLSTSFKKLMRTKPYVERMIFNLFYYSNKNPELKNGEQNLLKSLLSLNLFLYYSKNARYIGYGLHGQETYTLQLILKKSIVQSINGIERFRSKYCLVRENYYKNIIKNSAFTRESDQMNLIIYNTEHIASVLSSRLDRIYKIVHIKLENNNNFFFPNMYDPEFMMLKHLLGPGESLLASVNVRNDRETSSLIAVYESAVAKYNIKDILEFQNTLISVMMDVFIRQIHFSLKSLTEVPTYYDYLKELIDFFEDFLSETNVCSGLLGNYSDMIKSESLLDEILRNDIKDQDLLALSSLSNDFEKFLNDKFTYSVDQQTIANNESLFSLIDDLNDVIYKPFTQIVNLLSCEPHSNGDFYVDLIKDHEGKLNTADDYQFLSSMENLRYYIFAFMVLINSTTDDEENFIKNENVVHRSNKTYHGQYSSNSAEPSTKILAVEYNSLDVSKRRKVITNDYSEIQICSIAVLEYFKTHENNSEIKYILLPLIIRLQRSINVQLTDPTDFYEVSVLYQMLFLTNAILENYLLRKYKVPNFNVDLFKSNFSDLNPDHTISNVIDLKKIMENTVEYSIIQYDLNDLAAIYRQNMHDAYFAESDNQIKFNWNASQKCIFEVLEEMSRGVIDLNDLIRYQWFVVKFFVTKILMDIKFLIKFVENQKLTTRSTEHSSNAITIEINKFQDLVLPKSIRSFLDYLIRATDDVLNNENINIQNFAEVYRRINKTLKLLGLDGITESYKTVFDIQRLKENIGSFGLLLNEYSEEAKEVFVLKDLSLSSVSHSNDDDNVDIIGLEDVDLYGPVINGT